MNEKDYESFFWLHIRKAGGTSARDLLKPDYKEVDRKEKPKTFIQATPDEYNDIVNNFRVVLGEYQFKRALFAKKILYPDNWDSIFSFAFSREPIDRCMSMFYYLYYPKSNGTKILRKVKTLMREKKFYNDSYAFDFFLNAVEEAHYKSNCIYDPLGLHFTTHTAPVFTDITDEKGEMLIKRIYRTENLEKGINEVYEMCGIDKKVIIEESSYLNKNKKRGLYTPSSEQRNKIIKLFEKDFDIYENAL